MTHEGTKLDFSNQEIHIGLDLALKSWKVNVLVGDLTGKAFSQPPEPKVLARYLRRTYPGGHYHCVYEAGYHGFWIQRELQKEGIDCIVVNPADVPTMDKERRVKTDRVDARKLARSLRNGELQPLYVPSPEALDVRSIVRTRAEFVTKQTRCKNQIKGHLRFFGIQSEDEDDGHRYWSRRYIQWLESVQHERSDVVLESLLKELLFLRETICSLTRQIRAISRKEQYQEQVECLLSVPGIGMTSAMTILTEVIDINRFRSLDQLSSYFGLVPGEHSSGENQVITGITKRQNRALRGILIECAWIALREDPVLMQAFLKLSGKMSKNRAIIRIAHKLLNRIRFVLKHNQPYRSLSVAEE